jgi:hypothetical protein
MFLNLYSLVSRDLSGTGMLAIAFASVLGTLLVWDARGNRRTLNQRNR